MKSEIDALRAFANDMMELMLADAIDGDDLRRIAERHELIKPETRYAPCRLDGCSCAEYIDSQEFANGVICYRKTALLLGPDK